MATQNEAIADKESRKAADMAAIQSDNDARAKAWTPEQAQRRADRDAAEHKDFEALGKRGESDSYYLRSDMAKQAKASPNYDAALKEKYPDLHTRVVNNEQENVRVNVQAKTIETPAAPPVAPTAAAGAAAEAKAKPLPTADELKAVADKALKDQLEENLRIKKAKETELAAQGLNEVSVQRKGTELERDEFIMPRRIVQAYTEVNGKFYTKDTNRVVFEDKGEKLATSTTDKAAIADMVALAKAKQWESLKLGGSQEFRREAWLQAESQGIKTQGYTPKEKDLAALETLRQERATNSIVPVQERKAAQQQQQPVAQGLAPRHDLNKNQAVIHTEATQNLTKNIQEMQKRPGLADKSVEDLGKLAFWRGVVAENTKMEPPAQQAEALARFDKQAEDPQFLKRLNQETEAKINDKTVDRTQQKETPELSR